MPTQIRSFSLLSAVRASIIALGAAVPLFVLYIFIYMMIPANNFNGGLMGQAYEPPSTLGKIISTLIAVTLIFIDFQIGRRYYLKIQNQAVK